MGVVVDTSVWVEVERGRLAPGDLAALLGDEPVYLTPITIAELQYGVEQAATEAERNRRAAALARIKTRPCLILDKTTGELFGSLAAQLQKKGRHARHRVQDLWIASLAIQHGLKLLTLNERDFQDVPGLELIPLPLPRRRK